MTLGVQMGKECRIVTSSSVFPPLKITHWRQITHHASVKVKLRLLDLSWEVCFQTSNVNPVTCDILHESEMLANV